MNIIKPATPSGYSLFCDDFRMEANGKFFIIGLYNEGMLAESFPMLLPTFNILITYHERPTESDLPLKIIVTAPVDDEDKEIFIHEVAREPFVNAQTVLPDGIDDPLLALKIHASFMALPLKRPGNIKVRAYRGEDEIRLGSLRVQLRSDWDAEQKTRQEKLSGETVV